MTNKKAIFFDIDGTLLDFLAGIKNIREEVAKAIRGLQQEGHYVFVATGRPYAFLNKEILDFGFDGYILANGASIIINGKVLYNDYMDKEFVKSLTCDLDNHNIQYILETSHYSYLKEEFKQLNDFYKIAGVNYDLILPEYNIDDLKVQKIEVFCANKEEADICVSAVEKDERCGYFSSVSDKAYEIYLRRNTKAHGILKVLGILNIPIENSYAFGDGINDIEMLSTVGCGIAMGNASDEVKKYAHKITDTVHNDGVALGIKKYICC